MKYPSKIKHIDIESNSRSVDYRTVSKSKYEIEYKLSLLEELRNVGEYQSIKDLVEAKIESFVHELSLNSLDMISSYHIENIVGHSIILRFSKRQDIRLNLYLEDFDEMEIDNFDEAYLSYLQDSKRTIIVGSISQVAPKLVSLLS